MPPRIFVALPSKLLGYGKVPLDEYKEFVRILGEFGLEVSCPLEDIKWSPKQPAEPGEVMRSRLTSLEQCDALIALPIVGNNKSSGVMGYIYYAVARGLRTIVYIKGRRNLDAPWQLVGLQENNDNFDIVFYESNLTTEIARILELVHGINGNAESLRKNLPGAGECGPEDLGQEHGKYWHQRYELFSRWDEGIRYDAQGICSIKPESIANEIASDLTGERVLDAFCGLGGSAIAFARSGKCVRTFDTSKERLEMAIHNATLYGVREKIEFVHDDVFDAWRTAVQGVDAVYLDPSWGGPRYARLKTFQFADFTPVGSSKVQELLENCFEACQHVAISLPRNFNTRELTNLHGRLSSVESCTHRIENALRLRCHTKGTEVLFLTAYM
ncbi:MAG: RsmD family RNA methyltransferase [Planctomycetota bacterium]